MGFFGLFGQSEEEKRATEVRAGVVAPTRSERQRCWEARDNYFACLDANNIVDALKDSKQAAKACGKQSAQFEKDCATQWVSSLCMSLFGWEKDALLTFLGR
jgi:cytochrome c oxidase assembly factor 6